MRRTVFFTATAAWAMIPMAGCEGVVPPFVLPFGEVTAVQLFDETNYTVAFSVESAVTDPSAVTQVNWVFGDGGGFVEGPNDRATHTHRYDAPGEYAVTAYIFGPAGFVDEITTTIVVEENGETPNPPDPTDPDELPGSISAPSPADDAEDVAVDAELRWTSGILSDTHDVYFGTDESAVADATTDDDAFQANQEESIFDPGDLQPNTDYFWRIDGVNALGTTKGDVLHFTTARAPEAARNPTPGNGSVTARVDTLLAWTAGDRSDGHDVYFGTDASAVADATTDDDTIFQDNINATEFDPEDDAAEEAGQLLADTEYFWRIDEVGDGGVTQGDVWSFRTAAAPAKVTSPTPADGAVDVNVEQVLTWVATPDVETFDVYFGTDPIEVEEAQRSSPEFESNRGTTTFDPADLVGSTTYYWRIDSLGRGGTTKGDVFSFTTIDDPAQVTGPFQPLHASSNVTINPELSWNLGAGGGPTTQFKVYLSENNSAVVNGDAVALQSTQDVQFTTFEIEESSSLEPDTLYFWKVDAIGPGGQTDGPVLSFTTGSEPAVVGGPNPANNAKGIALTLTLQWSAATGADSYDVFFGTNQSDVDNADTDDAAFHETVNGTSSSPPNMPLEGNTQYFWRIDSRGPGGRTKGPLWRFTTAPATATAPEPFDGEDQIALDAALSWTAGAGATSHDVFLGTDENVVTTATRAANGGTLVSTGQAGTTFTPDDDLDGGTTYYWRIDERNGDGFTIGDVWEFTTIAGQATDPVPADGATGVSLTPSLDWTPDIDADSHDVYFGTTEAAVDEATTGSAEFQGNFIVGGGVPPFQPPNILDGLTFYFWRVDTVTPNGTVKGEVWRFRTRPGRATAPVPANFATDISPTTTLSWTPAAGAVTHEVFLSTSQSDVTNGNGGASLGLTNPGESQISPGTLTANTLYFWRVDSIAADGVTRTTGSVWRFTTLDVPAQASSPSPFSGATNIDVDVTLSWAAAARADTYDVYFGTNSNAVLNATTASPEFHGNQVSRTYQPGGLANNTTYYWRIDSVNDAGTRKGIVWSFTTEP